MSFIYGADTSKKITPEIVRDAIVNCFYRAHCADSSIDEVSSSNEVYCREIIKKMFQESGDDFESPNKDSILRLIQKLKDFSANFRDPEIIKQHEMEIMELVGCLK
ncbi:MAG: hypothetical protein PHH83_04765 [Patescibacteria group bacterium]|nr:hypothetical protein [Patescibacteria group bacterium]